MSWDELVAAALIGTDRRAVEGGAPGELDAVLAGRGVEDRLLVSAAAWTVARRAGARAGAPRVIEAAQPDPRPLCSPAAAGRLELLLEVRELVDVWLDLAARAGVRPPPELVPALLDHAAGWPERYAPVAAAAGPIGRWLAAREPRWDFVLPPGAWDAEEDREDLLLRGRHEDPDAARGWLEATFAEEPWEDREAFVQALEIGLSDTDEPFLEAALDDRRKPVRDAAAALLAKLPRSAFAARAAARAAGLLRVEGGRIVVSLPDAPDAAAQRDGVPTGGRRSERLTALVGAAPLSTWDRALVALPVADDLEAALHAGWARATLNQRDPEWARALDLLQLLPHAEAEARAAAADDPVRAAQPLDWTWGPALSTTVLKAIERRRAAGHRDGDVAFVGYRIDATVDAEPLRELGGRDIGRLCDVAAIRAAMLSEFA